MSDRILGDIALRLEKLNIFEMRQIARYFGVSKPAESKKEQLIREVLDIAQAKTDPKEPPKVGARPKSQSYDRELVEDIQTCRNYYLQLGEGLPAPEKIVLKVSDSLGDGYANSVEVAGILDKPEGYLLRNNGFTNPFGVFVHDSFVERFGLKCGDMVCGSACAKKDGGGLGLTEVFTVNGEKPPVKRRDFNSFTRIYPEVKVKTSHEGDIACRIIDIFSPLALGQRAFITGPANSGKSTVLKSMLSGIEANYSDIKALTLLIGARPEEVTDFKRTLGGEGLFYTTFDMPDEEHVQAVRLVAEYSKRLCEAGRNVILAIDGLGNFVRALKRDRVEELKKLLFSACNAEEGATLTVLVAAESEESLFGGVSSLADMCVELSGSLSKKRIFPAINIGNCFADRAEKLLSKEEAQIFRILKNGSADFTEEKIIELFTSSRDNAELLSRLTELK